MASLPDGITLDIPDLRVTITPRSDYVVKIQPVDEYHVVTFDTPTITRATSVFVDSAQSASYSTSASYAISASYAEVSATSSYADNFVVSGSVTANTFVGDGSGLTGVIAEGTGQQIRDDGTTLGVAKIIDFTDGIDASFASSTASISLNRTGSFSGTITTAETASSVSHLQQIVAVTGSINVTGSGVITEDMILRKEDQQVLFRSIITRNVYNETRQIQPTIPTGSYSGCQIEYHATKASSTRQGVVLGTWLNGEISYTDVSNLGIGNSDDLSFNMIISSDQAIVRAVSTGTDSQPWQIHTFLKTFSNIV